MVDTISHARRLKASADQLRELVRARDTQTPADLATVAGLIEAETAWAYDESGNLYAADESIGQKYIVAAFDDDRYAEVSRTSALFDTYLREDAVVIASRAVPISLRWSGIAVWREIFRASLMLPPGGAPWPALDDGDDLEITCAVFEGRLLDWLSNGRLAKQVQEMRVGRNWAKEKLWQHASELSENLLRVTFPGDKPPACVEEYDLRITKAFVLLAFGILDGEDVDYPEGHRGTMRWLHEMTATS